MTRFAIDGGQLTREDRWPTQDDLGAIVILPGGEAGVLTAWWNAGGRIRLALVGRVQQPALTGAGRSVNRCSRPRPGRPTPPR